MKRAILLMNMGEPNSLDEVELFLSNMVNDRRIIAESITWRKKEKAKSNDATLSATDRLSGTTPESL
ncbi:ferrochelatase [Sulfurimonas sp. HSL3-7]|uniref:ferrochelatase n=1 Tax=Sulfonitrofixus jiaomeiensis TaxID=3131938 RepID=UPI0031F7EB3D